MSKNKIDKEDICTIYDENHEFNFHISADIAQIKGKITADNFKELNKWSNYPGRIYIKIKTIASRLIDIMYSNE